MKLHFKIPEKLKIYFDYEINLYHEAIKSGEIQAAWRHLERAHILGQAYPLEHSYAHWLMLKFGIRIKSYNEVIGQIPRLLVGGVKSFVGKIPVGNTGGANVPPLKPMEIPKDLKEILSLYGDN
ncbi:hypothetical protein Ftrac_0627 [Sporocytophaga myxococcoides]|uniref:DUF3703 domain-containing protein n=1 Tax=Sporocytophaga myxococcoides TaxID=153721 RepID=A0A098LFW3_9BACT|nr:DUF3703 domain-containing protein [Sporocytophaga myxococcoides]GAL85856.1 hypothetical protein Ftrac_0627 [Sporocytophaga myxococcoides]